MNEIKIVSSSQLKRMIFSLETGDIIPMDGENN